MAPPGLPARKQFVPSTDQDATVASLEWWLSTFLMGSKFSPAILFSARNEWMMDQARSALFHALKHTEMFACLASVLEYCLCWLQTDAHVLQLWDAKHVPQQIHDQLMSWECAGPWTKSTGSCWSGAWNLY